jgi:hypothetical protein
MKKLTNDLGRGWTMLACIVIVAGCNNSTGGAAKTGTAGAAPVMGSSSGAGATATTVAGTGSSGTGGATAAAGAAAVGAVTGGNGTSGTGGPAGAGAASGAGAMAAGSGSAGMSSGAGMSGASGAGAGTGAAGTGAAGEMAGTGSAGTSAVDPTVSMCLAGVMASGATVGDCETCMCQVGSCQSELSALNGDAKGNALVACSKAHKCADACCICGTSSQGAPCGSDYANFGMGPCANEVQTADGKTPMMGVSGAIANGADIMKNCSATGTDATNSCTKALKLAACVKDKCASACMPPMCM